MLQQITLLDAIRRHAANAAQKINIAHQSVIDQRANVPAPIHAPTPAQAAQSESNTSAGYGQVFTLPKA